MATQFLRWIAGHGWLIFSGGNSAGSPIRAQTLTRANADGHIVYVSFADDGGDELMDDMEDLGAPSGYAVDIAYEDADSVREQLRDAAVIVFEIGTSLDALYRALVGDMAHVIQSAYENGAVVMFEGLAANVCGRWVVLDNGAIANGLNWVVNAFIEAESTSAGESRAVQAVLAAQADAVAINIGVGSALALGPQNAIELWGERQVTISLGRQYREDAD